MYGTIVKGVGGFYYVYADNSIYECKARGLFRKQGITPLVGDNVEFTTHEQGHCYIEAIEARTSQLRRPPVANVTHIAVVASAGAPKPDLLLIDKLFVWARSKGIAPMMVVNKTDEGSAAPLVKGYEGCVRVLTVSARTGDGMDGLKAALLGTRTVFAGQSAVGKSTLLNRLVPGLNLETGGLAKRTDRGKHTTRHVELIFGDGFELLDTPGFSVLEELPVEEPWELSKWYPEFDGSGECYFAECLHHREPGCAVKTAVNEGRIDTGRYERYLEILEEVKEKRARKYD